MWKSSNHRTLFEVWLWNGAVVVYAKLLVKFKKNEMILCVYLETFCGKQLIVMQLPRCAFQLSIR